MRMSSRSPVLPLSVKIAAHNHAARIYTARMCSAFPSSLEDIVQGDAGLMSVFEPLMRHMDEMGKPLFAAGAAFSDKANATMKDLTGLLSDRCTTSKSRHFGVIIDESQKITDAAEKHDLTYFKEGWYGWQHSPGNVFVRMDIASSHGAYNGIMPSPRPPPSPWSVGVGA